MHPLDREKNVKIKSVVLNIFTLGLWGLHQRCEFKKALRANQITKANAILSRGAIKEIGQNFLDELFSQRKNDALYWLANKNASYSIAYSVTKKMKSPQELDDFLCCLPATKRGAIAKANFDWKDIAKTTVLIKHGLGIDTIKNHIKHEITSLEQDNINRLKFYLDHRLDPNSNPFLTYVCRSLKSASYDHDHHDAFKIGLEMMRLLLEKGADPNVHSDHSIFGRPPLHIFSRQKNSYPYVELLLEHGANPNLKFGDSTVYEMYLHNSPDAKSIALLHEKGGKIQQELLDKVFENVVHQNSGRLDYDIAQIDKLIFLKSLGAKITPATSTKAFNLAIKEGNHELAHFFLKNGADSSQFDEFVKRTFTGS
jgi:ankyrin repeat protein